ncbi:MAG: SIMPL domain-containing protein [bacterium]
MKNLWQIGLMIIFITAIGIGIAIWQPWKINSRTVQTVGEGKIKSTPDVSKIQGSVEVKKPTADEAKTASMDTMSKIVDAVKAAGVEEKDILTDSVSTSPNMNYLNGITSSDGYTGRISITVTVRDLTKATSIVDLITKNGGTGIYGPNLTFSDEKYNDLKQQAQTAAIVDARAKADLMAKAGDSEVGKVINIAEGNYSPNQPIYAMDSISSSAKESVSSPIQAGESEVTASVSVTFGLK